MSKFKIVTFAYVISVTDSIIKDKDIHFGLTEKTGDK